MPAVVGVTEAQVCEQCCDLYGKMLIVAGNISASASTFDTLALCVSSVSRMLCGPFETSFGLKLTPRDVHQCSQELCPWLVLPKQKIDSLFPHPMSATLIG